jgi:hypothetical protein
MKKILKEMKICVNGNLVEDVPSIFKGVCGEGW